MKKIKKFDFKPVAQYQAQSKYDWNTLLDGGIYELEASDLQHTVSKFIGLLRWKAKQQGKEVQYNKTAEGGVVIRAGESDPAKVEEFKATMAERKAAYKERKATQAADASQPTE